MKKALFLRFLGFLLITYKYLITVSLENETIVLEKLWEKSWILDPKICTLKVQVPWKIQIYI